MSLIENSQKYDSPDIIAPKVLLPWSDDGLLPFVEIEMSPAQLLDCSLVTGTETSSDAWDLGKRKRMARDLLLAAQALSKIESHSIIISGEFVERLADPVSIEGYFEVQGDRFALPALHEYLSVLEPRLDWSSLLGRQSEALVKLYPVLVFTNDGTVLKAPTAPIERFHQDSEGRQKGVVRLTSQRL
jgi:hypothetical protein